LNIYLAGMTFSHTEDTYRLAVIVGSNREGAFGPSIARWFVAQAEARDDVEVDLIDIGAIDLPVRYGSGRQQMADFLRRIDEADAFVVVTPEYNHSYPASLKQAIDHGKAQWEAKPVAFVSYGGVSGGLRAVEHLRGVFAELHATTIRDTVSLHRVFGLFDEDGELIEPQPVIAAAKTMLDSLNWWALALKRARAERPYRR
jgi:NAD(P)H-dependent FMN reductase